MGEGARSGEVMAATSVTVNFQAQKAPIIPKTPLCSSLLLMLVSQMTKFGASGFVLIFVHFHVRVI